MSKETFYTFTLIILSFLMILAGCGGGGDSTSSGTVTQTLTGVAVDPYIEGAKFFQDTDGNGVYDSGEPLSSASDSEGKFTFSNVTIEDGKAILMHPDNKGKHLGVAFEKTLKTLPDLKEGNNLIVSPFTSLIANNISKANIVTLFNDALTRAGVNSSLSESDLVGDPMAAIANLDTGGTITEDQLTQIRTVIAANQYMKVLNTDYGSITWDILNSTANKAILDQVVNVVKNGCDPAYVMATQTTINTLLTAAQTQFPLFTDSSKNQMKLKVEDIAKVCVTIANYASEKIKKGEAVNTAITQAAVKQLGPRYYLLRLKKVAENDAIINMALGFVTVPVDTQGNTVKLSDITNYTAFKLDTSGVVQGIE